MVPSEPPDSDAWMQPPCIRTLVQKIAGFIRKVVGDGHEVQDLTQDVCVQVLQEWHTLRDTSKWESWIYRIAVNTALSHRRWRQLWRFEVLPEDGEAQPYTPDRLGEVEANEFINRIRVLVEPGDVALFSLRKLDEFTGKELAALHFSRRRCDGATKRVEDAAAFLVALDLMAEASAEELASALQALRDSRDFLLIWLYEMTKRVEEAAKQSGKAPTAGTTGEETRSALQKSRDLLLTWLYETTKRVEEAAKQSGKAPTAGTTGEKLGLAREASTDSFLRQLISALNWMANAGSTLHGKSRGGKQ